MKMTNRVELVGMVSSVRILDAGGHKSANITLATSRAYRDAGGAVVVDTAWHNVSAWKGKGAECLDKITKGDKLRVVGSLQYNKITGADGLDHIEARVIASEMEILDVPLEYEIITAE